MYRVAHSESPCSFPSSATAVFQVMWPRCPHLEIDGNILSFPKEGNCDVPDWFIQGFFSVFRVMGPWCPDPVKFKMSQNGVPEMIPSGTFRMSWPLQPQCTTFSIIRGNFGNTTRKCLEHWKTQYILNVPSISPKFPQIIPKVVHCGRRGQDIINVPLRFILGTPFWLILNFTGSGHHGHTTRKTEKIPE